MKRVITILTLLLFQNIYAQGEYIERGNNAYAAGASVAIHQKVYGLSLAASVSTMGTFDIGLSYAFLLSKENVYGIDQISTAIAPFVTLHIIKQSSSFPISISAVGHYQLQKFNSTHNQQSISLSYWTYGGSIFHFFEVSEQYSIQPFITYTLTKSINEKEIDTISATELSLSVISKIKSKKFIIHPSISISGDEIVYSLGFEFVNIFSM